jgi:hypothetical protein
MHAKRIAVVAILAVAVVPIGGASAASYKRLRTAKASGDYATTNATGTAKRPKAIYVAVGTSPRQAVRIEWTMTCSKGVSASGKSGHFTTSSSAKHKIPMPFSKATDCIVAAGGQLPGSGKLTISIYQR